MSSAVNPVDKSLGESWWGNAIYQEVSSVPSSIRSNPFWTVGLLAVNMGAGAAGQTVSVLTRGYLQLNTFVPQRIRQSLRGIGQRVGRANEDISHRLSQILPMGPRLIESVMVAPVLEELVFRLPLLVASSQIDAFKSEFLSSPVLEGWIDASGGDTAKAALAILLSIAFTYGHQSNPTPNRATGLFASGLALSRLALKQAGGLGNAMVAHMVHNFCATVLWGAEMGRGITATDPSPRRKGLPPRILREIQQRLGR